MRGALRTKPISNGRKLSLYIDYYPKVWNPVKRKFTRREFLNIHLVKFPETLMENQMNAINQEIAEKIYVGRMKSLMLDENGFFNKDALDADFFIFSDVIIRNKQRDGIDVHHYEMAIKYLKGFVGAQLKFKRINELFIKSFRGYLLIARSSRSTRVIAKNTASSYFDKVLFLCKVAYCQKYLTQDYTLYVDRIAKRESHFELLDDDELQVLLDNPCENELVFKSSIFSLLTGLRFGAIKSLKWGDLHFDSTTKGWYIHFVDPKPDRSFTHYINQQAVNLLGKLPRRSNQLVFEGLNYSIMRYHLLAWFSSLGMKDKAKFHNWRRLYATKLLEAGEDIYTVSKMINHKNIKTTTRYVQVRTKTKVRAAEKIELKSKNVEVAMILEKKKGRRIVKNSCEK